MSDHKKEVGLVDHNPTSIAVMGAEGHTGFEATDAPAKVVIYALGIVAVTATFAFVLMFAYDKFLEGAHPRGSLPSPLAPERVVPPAPQIQRLPWLDLPQLRAHENEVLKSTGTDPEGHAHVPIDKAIDEVVAKLNGKSGEAVGITVPGGQDRVFSHSLADMPAAYQRPNQPLIKGEIHKNAQ